MRCWSTSHVTSVCSDHTFVLLSGHPSSSPSQALPSGETSARKTGRFWAELCDHTPGLPAHTFAVVGPRQRKDSRESKFKSGSEYQVGNEAELSFHMTHLFQRKGHRPHSQGRAFGQAFPTSPPSPSRGDPPLCHSQPPCSPDRRPTAMCPKTTAGRTTWHNRPPSARLLHMCVDESVGSLSRQVTDKLYSTG